MTYTIITPKPEYQKAARVEAHDLVVYPSMTVSSPGNPITTIAFGLNNERLVGGLRIDKGQALDLVDALLVSVTGETLERKLERAGDEGYSAGFDAATLSLHMRDVVA